MFPNPSNSQIQVNVKTGNSIYNLRVINIYGQSVYKKDEMSVENFILDKSITGDGLFILQIQIGNKFKSKKFLFK